MHLCGAQLIHCMRRAGCHLSLALFRRRQHYILRSLASLQQHTVLRAEYPRSYTTSTCSVRDILTNWEQKFKDENIPEPESSAQLIIAHVLGKKMIHEVDINAAISVYLQAEIDRLCKMRLERVPVQYAIEEWDFRDLTLKMRSPVLIPRPETEELAGIVVEDWRQSWSRDRQSRALEIGCGSGAITLYMLNNIPELHMVAVDVNEVACDLTLENAHRLNLQHRLTLIHGDICSDSVVSELRKQGRYRVIVSNPPYITTEQIQHLDTEITRYEDHRALDGGKDGLDVIKRILHISTSLLQSPGGVVWLEVGLEHPVMIEDLVSQSPSYGLIYDGTFQDMSKRDRFCKLLCADDR